MVGWVSWLKWADLVEDKKWADLVEEKKSTNLVEEKKLVELVEVTSGRGKNRSVEPTSKSK